MYFKHCNVPLQYCSPSICILLGMIALHCGVLLWSRNRYLYTSWVADWSLFSVCRSAILMDFQMHKTVRRKKIYIYMLSENFWWQSFSLHELYVNCAAGVVDGERIVLKAIFTECGIVRLCWWMYCCLRGEIWRITTSVQKMTNDAQTTGGCC